MNCRETISVLGSQDATYKPTAELSWNGDVEEISPLFWTLVEDLNNPIDNQHKFTVTLKESKDLPDRFIEWVKTSP